MVIFSNAQSLSQAAHAVAQAITTLLSSISMRKSDIVDKYLEFLNQWKLIRTERPLPGSDRARSWNINTAWRASTGSDSNLDSDSDPKDEEDEDFDEEDDEDDLFGPLLGYETDSDEEEVLPHIKLTYSLRSDAPIRWLY